MISDGRSRPDAAALRIETERLTIRPFVEDDAPFVLRLVTQPSWIANVGDRGVRTVDDARRYLRDGPIAAHERDGLSMWRVALREGDVPVGMAGLLDRDALDDVDLGYALLAEHEGRGYAIEAARAVLDHGRTRRGLRRVVAVVDPDNPRSIALLVKLGFAYERDVRMPGEDRDIRMYARSFDDRPAGADGDR